MIGHEVGKLKNTPFRKEQLVGELSTVKSEQTSLIQQIQQRHAEGRPRLVILDDQLDGLAVTRGKPVMELAISEVW